MRQTRGMAIDDPSNNEGGSSERADTHNLFLSENLRPGTKLVNLTPLGSCSIDGTTHDVWEGTVQETGS